VFVMAFGLSNLPKSGIKNHAAVLRQYIRTIL
jgi:hypothetical protein